MNDHSYWRFSMEEYMKEYEVKYLEVETGEKIAYRQAGKKGPTVLLVHGNMSSSVHFVPLMEILETKYKVYAIDLRGAGDSSYNKPVESLEDFSKDITSFIKLMKLKKINIVGWSTGGGIALETAVDNQETIEHVFLLSSVGVQGYKMYGSYLNSFGMLSTKVIFDKADFTEDALTFKQILHAFKAKDKDYFKLLWDQIYTRSRPTIEDYEKYLEAVLKQRNYLDLVYGLTNFNMTTTNNGVNDGSGRLFQLRCPVTIMHGDDDGVAPIEDAKLTAKFIGDRAELIVFKNRGHSLITDDLERVYLEITTRIK